jgi:hypothetical protein
VFFKARDRAKKEWILGPTHEEVITTLIASEINSYRQLPKNFYQIQLSVAAAVPSAAWRPRRNNLRLRLHIERRRGERPGVAVQGEEDVSPLLTSSLSAAAVVPRPLSATYRQRATEQDAAAAMRR